MKNKLILAGVVISALCLNRIAFGQNQFMTSSNRGTVGTGEGVLINEFTVAGSGTVKVVLRALGPSLSAANISGTVQDPTLVLSNSAGTVIAFNDNWKDTQQAEITAAGLAPTDTREAVIVATLSPGTYVAVERGKNNTTGVGLNEIYNISGSGSTATIVAIGTRGQGDVQNSAGALLCGFQTGTQENILVRVLGPSLTVTGPVPDPSFTVVDSMGSSKLSNDDWQSSQQSAIQASGLAPSNTKEAAATGSLAAGTYIGITNTKGVNGIAFFQAYVLPASAALPPNPPTPPPPTAAQLLNISTRMQVLTSDKVLIGGFIVTGTDPKKVIIRGIGPSLKVNNAPIPGRLADPTLELHKPDGSVVTNDNWKINGQTGQSQEAEITATTIPPSDNLESAIVATLSPGNYTAVMAGKNGGTGIGVVEVYDLAQAANSKLANISSRGFVDLNDNVMIGGFIVGGGSGGGTANVMIRAIGPSLTANGSPVPGRLGDPTLELHDASGTTLATNDNWKINDQTGQSQEAQITATTIPPPNNLESALVATLAPGNYTAVVRGKNNTTGVGLVEVYNLQ